MVSWTIDPSRNLDAGNGRRVHRAVETKSGDPCAHYESKDSFVLPIACGAI